MRSFIAVNSSTAELWPLVEELKSFGQGVKPVEHENLHITLKFLGEVEEEILPSIRQIMAETARKMEPFRFSLKGVGTLPSRNFIKVVFSRVEEGGENLVWMQKDLEKRLSKLGFKKEKREFKPHVTIARVKSARPKNKILKFIERHQKEELGDVKVDNLLLMKSRLTPGGPVYTALEELYLGG